RAVCSRFPDQHAPLHLLWLLRRGLPHRSHHLEQWIRIICPNAGRAHFYQRKITRKNPGRFRSGSGEGDMMENDISHWVLSIFLILSALGVVFSKKPVYSGLSFLLALLLLSALYVELAAEFIGIMQVLIYAGAILVIFMFVMILFQDAHQQIDK